MKTPASKDDLNRSRIHVNNMIQEVTDSIMSKQQPDSFDTALVKRINTTCEQCFHEFKRMHNIQVTPMRKADAIEHIRKLYRDKLTTWTKDELLEAFSLVQATLGAEAFHEELI